MVGIGWMPLSPCLGPTISRSLIARVSVQSVQAGLPRMRPNRFGIGGERLKIPGAGGYVCASSYPGGLGAGHGSVSLLRIHLLFVSASFFFPTELVTHSLTGTGRPDRSAADMNRLTVAAVNREIRVPFRDVVTRVVWLWPGA
ncbi:hypothetical protein H6P81_007570 [Aristolochia fimbriata]|uniref:Uncharacterized protein n=1 Tax=Aristolochia fimbriata TaxID=158543 RepID=A0AAV7F4B6_ARIFI|nr:hypothetical protein H6P81_007570 [Aristolochia fimbriata]